MGNLIPRYFLMFEIVKNSELVKKPFFLLHQIFMVKITLQYPFCIVDLVKKKYPYP